MIQLVIPGTPIAKKRPRFVVRNGHGRAYSAQETEEGRLLLDLRQQYQAPPMEGSLQVHMVFYFAPGKSDSQKTRARKLSGEEGHTKKPDVDNLIKFYFDVMNGHVWADDALVTSVLGEKRYAEHPRIEITVWKQGEKPVETTPEANVQMFKSPMNILSEPALVSAADF
jgi:Holliday junction resolvase RusA-like endonuclease